MDPAPVAAHTRPPTARWAGRLVGFAVVAATTATVGVADPSRTAIFPACPSRTLFGVDCPLCGGLRGTHALLRGRIAEALDHNLLLPGLLALLALALFGWLAPLAGRPAPAWRVPRWFTIAAVAVAVAFTVARNLPVDALSFLGSDAS